MQRFGVALALVLLLIGCRTRRLPPAPSTSVETGVAPTVASPSASASELAPSPDRSPTPSISAPTATQPPFPSATPRAAIDTPDWFADAVLYEIMVRSFYDQDGDGIGDLSGLTARLDYIQELGATALWLTPIHPSPSYHGYDVTDHFAVHPELGSLSQMIALVEAAHQRGMRVLMDLVVHHTADEHPFFQDAWGNPNSEYADWYLWTNPDHTAYHAFAGSKHMPKLNHDNPEVVAYVLEIARFWMDLDGDGDHGDGVDGFRCDVAKEVPLTTWQTLRAEMRRLNPDALLLGEVWDENVRNLARWYEGAFDALFDFPLYGDLAGDPDVSQDSLLAGVQSPDLLTITLLGEEKLLPAGYEIVRFVNNHDTNRVMSEVGGDPARARLAAMVLLTLPGTPMIYYGEEIGMRGEKGKGNPYWDEYRREPMDWYAAESGPGMATWFKPADRFNASADGISVEEQAGVAGSLLEHYRALVALRHAHPALRSGSFAPVPVAGADSVYAYVRHAPPTDHSVEEWFLVVLNFGPEASRVELEPDLGEVGPLAAVDALTGASWPEVRAGAPYPVELAPASGVILQLSRP